MKLVHITDTHFTEPGALLFEDDPVARLAVCIDDINRNHADADLCIVTGDLVHNGTIASYQLLQQSLETLSIPCQLVLGNHDDRDNFKSVFPAAGVDEHGFVQCVRDVGENRFVFLDTLQRGTHEGVLCEQRLAWFEKALREAEARPVFLAMHHPPMRLHHASLDKLALRQSDAFQSIIHRFKNVRHLFFGHVHRSVTGSWNGVSYSALNGTNGLCWLDFGLTSTPLCSLPQPVYSTVYITSDDIVIHTHSPTDPSPRFRYDPYGVTGVEFQRVPA